jgi:hypothetical protein
LFSSTVSKLEYTTEHVTLESLSFS